MDAHRLTPFVYLFVYSFKAEWCELQHLLSCCGKPAGGFNPLIKWVDLRSPVEHFNLIWPSLFTTAIHVNEFRQSWRLGWQHKCQLCSNLVTYQSRIITINRTILLIKLDNNTQRPNNTPLQTKLDGTGSKNKLAPIPLGGDRGLDPPLAASAWRDQCGATNRK